ncbi:MAG TPA: lipoyl synthase [Planctomycetaceae bacterium]|nr:lipoyl synthase [Planctomycetaceae bacterium]HIQ21090.1 lipoyl synthase [Planctomycetota bacterium]
MAHRVELPMSGSLPQLAPSPRTGLPRWLKRNVPKGNANHYTARLIAQLGLETVCEHARCPNRMECYAQKTATFMILGPVCTRRCAFCSVPKGKTRPVDAGEPERLAEAAQRLGLEHVVITSVTRDDLADGGASHFVQCIRAVRRATKATIEVLPGDFAADLRAVDLLIDAAPDVYNHNTETVPRLYPRVRGRKADYRWTLELFRHIRRRAPAMKTKTGLMLGLGETTEELLDTLADLAEAGCEMLTLGQYLRPSPAQMEVARYVPPDEFQWLGQAARRMGFLQVASGPFVRSSYHARAMLSGP